MTTRDQTEAKTTPQLCPRCRHRNRVGIVFCEKCGKALVARAEALMQTQAASEDELDKSTQRVPTHRVGVDKAGRGGAFHPGMVVRFLLYDYDQPIDLMPAVGSPIVFGRVDTESNHRPDVNLMPYGGFESGISRNHATIMLVNRRLLLMDTGSSNGTYLNDQQLKPHKPIELRPGDFIRMGGLTFEVMFGS